MFLSSLFQPGALVSPLHRKRAVLFSPRGVSVFQSTFCVSCCENPKRSVSLGRPSVLSSPLKTEALRHNFSQAVPSRLRPPKNRDFIAPPLKTPFFLSANSGVSFFQFDLRINCSSSTWYRLSFLFRITQVFFIFYFKLSSVYPLVWFLRNHRKKWDFVSYMRND